MADVKWTTHTIVLQYLKGCGTSLTQGEIENFITMNEGVIEAMFKIPRSFVFDSLSTFKPPFAVRQLVTLLSALDVIASTPQSFNSFTAIDATTQVLVAKWNEVIAQVNNPSFEGWFKNSDSDA